LQSSSPTDVASACLEPDENVDEDGESDRDEKRNEETPGGAAVDPYSTASLSVSHPTGALDLWPHRQTPTSFVPAGQCPQTSRLNTGEVGYRRPHAVSRAWAQAPPESIQRSLALVVGVCARGPLTSRAGVPLAAKRQRRARRSTRPLQPTTLSLPLAGGDVSVRSAAIAAGMFGPRVQAPVVVVVRQVP
jgi:hypothetical protein